MKAEAGIPVASLLHAYRLAGLEALRTVTDEAARFGETAIVLDTVESLRAILDRFSNAASDEYRAVVEALRRRQDESRRAALLALLEGSDAAGNAARLDLPPTGAFVVVAARVAASAESGDPVAPAVLRSCGAGAVWASSPAGRIGLVNAHATADLEALLVRLDADPGTAIGISRVFDRPAGAVTAGRQARLALLALGGGGGVRRFESRPVDVLLVSEPASATELRDLVLGNVLRLRDDDAEKLLSTLEAWIASDGSAAAAGEALHCHRNSVLYRLQRLESLSGRRVRSPLELAELVAAVRAHRLVG